MNTDELKAKAIAASRYPGPWKWNEQGWLVGPDPDDDDPDFGTIIVESPGHCSGPTAVYLAAVDPTTIMRLIEFAERQSMLLAQTGAIADERTRERDQLRAAMPAGLAFEQLISQIRRLRRTPCPTMGFDPAGGPGTRSIRNELAELEAEEPGTSAWRSELLDVFTCAAHLMIAADMLVDASVAEQAASLRARLDHIDRGGTWAEAKQMETCPACSGGGGGGGGDDGGDCLSCRGCGFRIG